MGLTNNKIGCDGQQGCVEQTMKLDGKQQGNNGQQTVVLSAPANLEKNSRPMHAERRLHTYAKRSDRSAKKDPACVWCGIG